MVYIVLLTPEAMIIINCLLKIIMPCSIILNGSDGILVEQSTDDDFNQKMVYLAREVAQQYMTDEPKCVMVISDEGLLADFSGYDSTAILRMHFRGNKSACDPDLYRSILLAFYENCHSYIVQISNPSCFFPSWFRARNAAANEKHTPRVMFLPIKPDSTSYGEEILSMSETDIARDILIAEVTDADDWPISLFTNNFWQRVGNPGRTGMISIDKWSWDVGFERNVDLYPDKVKDLKGKVLRIATFSYLPYSGTDPLDGSEIRMFTEFCIVYNCSVIAINDGNLWGKVFPNNGSGIGIAGAVYSEKADFGAAANYLWLEFWPYIEYSNCYLYGGVVWK